MEKYLHEGRRILFNFWPCLWCSGGYIEHIGMDYRYIRVRIRLNWKTRNYVGTIYGGSMYSATDPFYMLMILKNLGNQYVVWDKAAIIKFLKPGKSTLYAHFRIDEQDLSAIRESLRDKTSVDKTFKVELRDKEGVLHALIDKVIYIAVKNPG